MRRRGWLWFVASALLALLAGVVAIAALRAAVPGSAPPPEKAELQVVTAAQAIAAGSRIGVQDLRVVPYPDPPSGAAFDTEDVLGKWALRDLVAGDAIRMQHISGVITDVHRYIPDDKIAVALPADDILSQWGAVLPGDHVDVLFTLDMILETPMTVGEMGTSEAAQSYLQLERDQGFDNVSLLTIQDLEVLQIIEEPQAAVPEEARGEEEAPPQPLRRALILVIDPQDAAVIKYIRDSVGSVDLALRSRTNSRLFEVSPVNINYLMRRYGIVLPQPPE